MIKNIQNALENFTKKIMYYNNMCTLTLNNEQIALFFL